MARLHPQDKKGKEEGMGCPEPLPEKVHLLRSGNQDFAHLVSEGLGGKIANENINYRLKSE